MLVNITVTQDQIDELLVYSLQEIVETPAADLDFLEYKLAALRLLEYYMIPSEFDKYFKDKINDIN